MRHFRHRIPQPTIRRIAAAYLSCAVLGWLLVSSTPTVEADANRILYNDDTSERHIRNTQAEAESHDKADTAAPPRYKRALPSAVVLIDAGHGGIDGGTNTGDILEKHINLAVAQKLYLLLRSQGITAVLNRTGDYALSEDNRWHVTRSRHRRDLSQRKGLTEEIDTTLFVSLHVNAAKSSSKRGPLVLHQRNGESALLAFCIQDALNRLQKTNAIPREGQPYYLLRSVRQPAVIVEMGFLSNPADRAMLTNRNAQTKLAVTIAAGLRQYLLIAGAPNKLGQLDDDGILSE
ncbi:N-acetylmuramoyl-L-alanine amidase CwlD [Paenibacillus cellulosilyticus]|uniref:N-acetylmuramoyl-L-alanine amidase CwlD n=1 Tax=Paenibacillus cellulosilyticus TaxID=375489 RepID=A0A2V2YEG8_9BACL|nr:N-acetylmuramoyl-L-alanine amidase [Paenibacillus cellulosilyticus]PWV90986.1 N-acetylmuramoyl-L-alanine amidase CwlD [Paenibacillus cellulosilyticus]QKS45201.1 N-acetylmuramoyl-L-alanine amidase [Paenibacillus cellulosilyticus]